MLEGMMVGLVGLVGEAEFLWGGDYLGRGLG